MTWLIKGLKMIGIALLVLIAYGLVLAAVLFIAPFSAICGVITKIRMKKEIINLALNAAQKCMRKLHDAGFTGFSIKSNTKRPFLTISYNDTPVMFCNLDISDDDSDIKHLDANILYPKWDKRETFFIRLLGNEMNEAGRVLYEAFLLGCLTFLLLNKLESQQSDENGGWFMWDLFHLGYPLYYGQTYSIITKFKSFNRRIYDIVLPPVGDKELLSEFKVNIVIFNPTDEPTKVELEFGWLIQHGLSEDAIALMTYL